VEVAARAALMVALVDTVVTLSGTGGAQKGWVRGGGGRGQHVGYRSHMQHVRHKGGVHAGADNAGCLGWAPQSSWVRQDAVVFMV
jgi:hypothetical protein